jgi:uncharacterized damage-inducible protein DinB
MSVFTNPPSSTAEEQQVYVGSVLDLLGNRDPVAILEELPAAVSRAITGLSDRALRQPEGPGKWSIVEVVQHLADSDLVWGFRLRMVIAHDNPTLTGYDQNLWAARLGYRNADPAFSLRQLRVLRETNLRLIESLDADQLQRTGHHVERGPESVEFMLKLYAGHDLVHRRQIDRIKAAVTA